ARASIQKAATQHISIEEVQRRSNDGRQSVPHAGPKPADALGPGTEQPSIHLPAGRAIVEDCRRLVFGVSQVFDDPVADALPVFMDEVRAKSPDRAIDDAMLIDRPFLA